MATSTAVRSRTKTKAVKDVEEALVPSPLGQLIDDMFVIREKKREIETEIAKLEAEYKEIEERLLERMEKEGTSAARGKKASASVSMSTVGSVTDWSAVEQYIKKTGHFQLFQRRLSDGAYREILEDLTKRGKPVAIPGIDSFTKKRVNVRTVA